MAIEAEELHHANDAFIVIGQEEAAPPSVEWDTTCQIVDSLSSRGIPPPFPIETEVEVDRVEPKRRWSPDELRTFGSFLVGNKNKILQYLVEDGVGMRRPERVVRFYEKVTQWFTSRGEAGEEVEVTKIPVEDIQIKLY